MKGKLLKRITYLERQIRIRKKGKGWQRKELEKAKLAGHRGVNFNAFETIEEAEPKAIAKEAADEKKIQELEKELEGIKRDMIC